MILYKRNAKGEPLYWNIDQSEAGGINLHYGAVGGHDHYQIIPQKLIKADEIQSRIKAKRKEGYKEAIELKDNTPMEIAKSSLASFLDMYLPKNNTTQDGFVLPMLAKVLKDNKPFTKSDYIGQYKINGLRCIIGAIPLPASVFTITPFLITRQAVRFSSIRLIADFTAFFLFILG